MDVTSIWRGRRRAIKKSIRAIKVSTSVYVCVCVYLCGSMRADRCSKCRARGDKTYMMVY